MTTARGTADRRSVHGEVSGTDAVAALVLMVRELLALGAVERGAVETASDRLLRSGGELWMDGWGETVETTAAFLAEAAADPRRRCAVFQDLVDTVEAGVAAAELLPVLVRMYPEIAAELPEALAGLARARLIRTHGAAALLARLGEDVEEGAVRFEHAVAGRRSAPGIADA